MRLTSLCVSSSPLKSSHDCSLANSLTTTSQGTQTQNSLATSLLDSLGPLEYIINPSLKHYILENSWWKSMFQPIWKITHSLYNRLCISYPIPIPTEGCNGFVMVITETFSCWFLDILSKYPLPWLLLGHDTVPTSQIWDLLYSQFDSRND